MTQAKDQWAQWLLQRRHGGDEQRLQIVLDYLYPIRDKVLENARLAPGDIVLDVGCGDGLISFGALARSEPTQVIFTDISQDLLEHVEQLAEQMSFSDRSQFIEASADDLAPIPDESVSVVTVRSVLIYVQNKQKALDSFFRVLSPGGRLSIFEPINRFSQQEPEHILWGYDVTAVLPLAQKVRALYDELQPPDDPMLDFDERDLLAMIEKAGFRELRLELRTEILPHETLSDNTPWETMIRIAPNPRIPSLEEAMRRTLNPAEIEEFTRYLRPMVEGKRGTLRHSVAYFWATKLK